MNMHTYYLLLAKDILPISIVPCRFNYLLTSKTGFQECQHLNYTTWSAGRKISLRV